MAAGLFPRQANKKGLSQTLHGSEEVGPSPSSSEDQSTAIDLHFSGRIKPNSHILFIDISGMGG
jgi:hypothetical protein